MYAAAWQGAWSAGPPGAGQDVRPLLGTTRLGDYVMSFDGRGLTGLAAARDPYGAQVLAPTARLGVVLKYRAEGSDRLEVDRDGFAAEAPIAFDLELRRVAFTLENRTGDRHTTALAIATPGAADQWEIRVDGRPVDLKPSASTDYPLRAEIPMGPGPARVEMARR
jgi:hypothetical protein